MDHTTEPQFQKTNINPVNKAVLVTGGAGYVGSHTCKLLAKNGYVPVTVDRHFREGLVSFGPNFNMNLPQEIYILDQFIKRYKNRIIVIKYGGYALTKPHFVKSFAKNIALLNQLGMKVIIVHGGGPQIENQLREKKIKNEEYQGLRVTTKQILSVVKTVLANDLNKLISNEITKYGGKPKQAEIFRRGKDALRKKHGRIK